MGAKRRKNAVLTNKEKEEIRELIEKGYKYVDIGRLMNIHNSTISLYALNVLGIRKNKEHKDKRQQKSKPQEAYISPLPPQGRFEKQVRGEQIQNLYRQGKGIKWLADNFKMSRAGIHIWLKRMPDYVAVKDRPHGIVKIGTARKSQKEIEQNFSKVLMARGDDRMANSHAKGRIGIREKRKLHRSTKPSFTDPIEPTTMRVSSSVCDDCFIRAKENFEFIASITEFAENKGRRCSVWGCHEQATKFLLIDFDLK